MLVIAHRGASAARRENTLPAFELAGLQGADGVELDVRRTADRRLRVLHDPALHGGAPLAVRADREIEPWIPTLTAALDAVRGLANVEIKDLPGEPGHDHQRTTARLVATALAERAEPVGRVLVSSFDVGALRAVHDVDPSLRLGLLTAPGLASSAVETATHLGAVAVHPADVDVDDGLVAAARSAGLAVNVWTVDEPDRIRELERWGVDAVITNDPARARAALGR